jgi:hypothetical protein
VRSSSSFTIVGPGPSSTCVLVPASAKSSASFGESAALLYTEISEYRRQSPSVMVLPIFSE